MLTQEMLLVSLYDALVSYNARHAIADTIEEFLALYPIFQFSDDDFIFSKSEKDSVFLNKYVSPFYKDAEGNECLYHGLSKQVCDSIMPFLTFVPNRKTWFDTYISVWYSSKELLKLLPTRKNIIDNLLYNLV